MPETSNFVTWMQGLRGSDILPDEFRTIAERLVAQEVTGFVVVAEVKGGGIMDAIFVDLDDHKTNRFALVGALENAKRDMLRMHVQSREVYASAEPEDDDDG